jgi:glycosyltransferase involved in cell wall biosynthesis
MRIAQVSPLYESVPPQAYGGTERVVSVLTEELVRQGHRVTLFASGDSRTSAELVPGCEEALRLGEGYHHRTIRHMLMFEEVVDRAHEFDVIHSHVNYLAFPPLSRQPTPFLTTLHGRLDRPEYIPVYRRFSDAQMVSISNSQRKPLPWLNWLGNVYHGLPEDQLSFHGAPGDYLAFLGRISPEKRVDRAIEVAKRAGMDLKIAAKVDPVDEDYFREVIEPLLRDPRIEFIGEIRDAEKDGFLGNAHALLFPIGWPEPFGLVMIEAFACGTPVVAFRNGSVPEVVDDGATGFIVESITEAVMAVERVSELSRDHCRRTFEARFTAPRMVEDYLNLYLRLLEKGHPMLSVEPVADSLLNRAISDASERSPSQQTGLFRDDDVQISVASKHLDPDVVGVAMQLEVDGPRADAESLDPHPVQEGWQHGVAEEDPLVGR